MTHPCHPPIFNDETDAEAKQDFFGGVKAKQSIVCALMQGPEKHMRSARMSPRPLWPVIRSHWCTVEQIAIMEPAMSETVGATMCLALREATDEAIRRGVPKDAAFDFMLGHLTIEPAIAFEVFPEGRFSDGALHAIEEARPLIFKEGWLDRVFSEEAVMNR